MGKLLALVLGVCLALTACQGRMPPPPPSENSAAPAVSAAPSAPAPPASGDPPESGSESRPPEPTDQPAPPEPASPAPSPEAPAESAAGEPAPAGDARPSAPAPVPEDGEGSGPSAPETAPLPAPEEAPAPVPAPPEDPAPAEEAPPPPEGPEGPKLPEECRWQSLTEAALLTMINKERVRQRQVPLTYDPELAEAARLRAEELFLGNYVAHTRPDGSPWETVLQREVPTEYAYAAENLAWSNHAPGEDLGAFQWFSLWKESRSHLVAMVGERYTHCGVAVLTGPYYEGEAQSYAVAVFCSY